MEKEILNKLPLVLYGAGKAAINEIKTLKKKEKNIVCFCDKDTSKQGTVYLGLPVFSIEQIREKYAEFNIYITVGRWSKFSVFEYLVNMGIKEERILNYKKDEEYLHADAPLTQIANHKNFMNYLSKIGNKKNMKILEIGSRVVTGANFRSCFSKAKYIGFDFYAGDNVDIVGDAHKLSAYFDKDEKFDIIFSHAVFEHFAMPWLVAIEISKLLKVGGIVYIETHFSYASHERPWHFFQFSDMALRVLFSPALGFECIEAGFSNPMVGRFSNFADDYLKNKPISGLYCHSDYLGKKIKDVSNFEWDKIKLEEVVGENKYPKSR
jgi:SAM-dependent methyltransferase